jgi:phosphate transport system substrate-binding protein
MKLRILLALLMASWGLSPEAHSQPQSITGAGASFPSPLYQRWAQSAQQEINVQLNYQSIGSGGGMNQIMNRTVDFGASDAPMTSDRLVQNNLIQIPMVMGAVVVAYNLPGVTAGALKLTPDVLADMYLGNIRRWNDARITQLNPGVRIPNLPVGVVYRGDGSGTTWIFTHYLSRVSEAWRMRSGAGTSISWPAGQGARGNEGVANMVQRTPGLIGYMEISFAQINRLHMAQLQNAAGNFVPPNAQTSRAAATNANWGSSLVPDLINQPGDQSWPIMGATYVILPANPTHAHRARAVNMWVTWTLDKGDVTAERLHYVPLPDVIKQQVLNRIQSEVRLP